MTGRINPNGTLEIKRDGRWVEQYCPQSSQGAQQRTCGHWCPGFQETFDHRSNAPEDQVWLACMRVVVKLEGG